MPYLPLTQITTDESSFALIRVLIATVTTFITTICKILAKPWLLLLLTALLAIWHPISIFYSRLHHYDVNLDYMAFGSFFCLAPLVLHTSRSFPAGYVWMALVFVFLAQVVAAVLLPRNLFTTGDYTAIF